jgi:exopolysaccharide production protein ExoQ
LDRNAAPSSSFIALSLLLFAAFALGGGGSSFALANLTVQLTAIGVLSAHRAAALAFWRESSLALQALIVVSLAIPIFQLIPLPPSVWSALPGRELAVRALELVGGPGWRPLSLDPLRTLLTLTALVTPLAVLVAGWSLRGQRLLDLGWLTVGLGLVTVLLGALQLGPGNAGFTLFGAREPGAFVLGTFANRNSTALFLGFAVGLAALLPAPKAHAAILPLRLAACSLLLVAIILTKSRTGLVLALIPLGLASLRLLFWAIQRRNGARSHARGSGTAVLAAIGAIALIGTGTAGLFLVAPGRVGETIERFQAKDDPRRFIWDDATYAAERYWPVGAGTGTFDEVFQIDESLENMTMRRAGRAHNDYIELAIESGVPGLAVAGLWLLLLGGLSWRVRHSPQRWAAWTASGFLLAIALQSITDYPLRNQTILAFAGFALLLLARIAFDETRGKR